MPESVSPGVLPPGPVLTPGLTTGQAPFIEEARAHGELYIEQRYELYSTGNHESWHRLYAAYSAALAALRK